MRQATFVLAPFSTVLGSPQADWPPQTVQTGFAFFDRDDELLKGPTTDHISDFMSSGPPPLVFTLGSTGVFTAGDFYIQAWQAAQSLGQRALLMVGPDDSVRLPKNTGPDCKIVKYAPHVRVFPQSSVVIHHGGVNTTGQALRSGRPQLVVPLAHDQFDNAARIQRSGCGLSLPMSRFEAKQAVVLLRRLLEEPEFGLNAKSAAGQVLSETGAVGAAKVIHDFLNRTPAVWPDSRQD